MNDLVPGVRVRCGATGRVYRVKVIHDEVDGVRWLRCEALDVWRHTPDDPRCNADLHPQWRPATYRGAVLVDRIDDEAPAGADAGPQPRSTVTTS